MEDDKLLEEAFKQIDEANKKVLESVKDDEAILECGGMSYYTVKKDELETFSAFVSNDNETARIEVIYTEDDEEFIEDYINKLGDKAPTGTFYIEFWGRDVKTSYEYDEWDLETSLNYKIDLFSSYNFERALKQIKRVKQVNKQLLQRIIKLQYGMEQGSPMGIYDFLEEVKSIKNILNKEVNEVR